MTWSLKRPRRKEFRFVPSPEVPGEGVEGRRSLDMPESNGNGSHGKNAVADWTAAWADEAAANFSRIARIPFLWQRAQSVSKGATPSEVVYEEDRIKLLHYPTEGPPAYKTPLLFV